MASIESFETLFAFDKKYTYPEEQRRRIESRRKTLHGSLFIDELFKSLRIDGSPSYPPSSTSALKHLIQSIHNSTVPTHHRHSLLLYIFLDVDEVYNHARHKTHHSEKPTPLALFEKKAHLPRIYSTAIRGLHAMDTGDYQTACAYLTEPALKPTFEHKVLATLLQALGETPLEDREAGRQLVLGYWHSVGLDLSWKGSRLEKEANEKLREGILDVLAAGGPGGIAAAYDCIQNLYSSTGGATPGDEAEEGEEERKKEHSKAEESRLDLFYGLIHHALQPAQNPFYVPLTATSASGDSDLRRSTRRGTHSRKPSSVNSSAQHTHATSTAYGLELVSLPLSESDDAQLETYLLGSSEGRALPHGRDTVALRRLVTGRSGGRDGTVDLSDTFSDLQGALGSGKGGGGINGIGGQDVVYQIHAL